MGIFTIYGNGFYNNGFLSRYLVFVCCHEKKSK